MGTIIAKKPEIVLLALGRRYGAGGVGSVWNPWTCIWFYLNQAAFKNTNDWTLPQPVKSESVRDGPGGTGILKLPEESSTGVRTADRGKFSPGAWDFLS